jgi:hypothetical protein
MPKRDLFEKTISSLFGIYLENLELQGLKKNSGRPIFKAKWQGKGEMHILIFEDFFKLGKRGLTPSQKMASIEDIKKSSSERYKGEQFLRISFKGIPNSKNEFERYSKLTPLIDDDVQIKMLFCAYDEDSCKINRSVLPHDLQIRFKGDINPFSDNKDDAKTYDYQLTHFIFRLSIPQNSMLPVSWEISPLTSEDGVSLNTEMFYQFNSHREKDLINIEGILKSFLKMHPNLKPRPQLSALREMTDEDRLMAKNGLKSNVSILKRFNEMSSQERDLRYLESLLRKMKRIQELDLTSKALFKLLDDKINSQFLNKGNENDCSHHINLDGSLFQLRENIEKRASLLKMEKSIDRDLVFHWIKDGMYSIQDHAFKEYLYHAILNLEIISDDIQDQIFDDENGVEFLMSYLDELRLRMKTQAKSIFDLDKSSLQNFLSKFVFWQSRNKDYDCLNDV